MIRRDGLVHDLCHPPARELLRELNPLVHDGEWQRHAEVGDLDRCIRALEQAGALNTEPSRLVTPIDHGARFVLTYEDIGPNGWCRVVVPQFQALVDPSRALG